MPTALALKMEERKRFQAAPTASCQRKSSRPPKTKRGSGAGAGSGEVEKMPLVLFALGAASVAGSSRVIRAAEVLAKSMGAGVGDAVVEVESLTVPGACASAAAALPSASKVHANSFLMLLPQRAD